MSKIRNTGISIARATLAHNSNNIVSNVATLSQTSHALAHNSNNIVPIVARDVARAIALVCFTLQMGDNLNYLI